MQSSLMYTTVMDGVTKKYKILYVDNLALFGNLVEEVSKKFIVGGEMR